MSFLRENIFYPQFLMDEAGGDGDAGGTQSDNDSDSQKDDNSDNKGTQSDSLIDKDKIFNKDSDKDQDQDNKSGDDQKDDKPVERPEFLQEKFWDKEKGEPRLENMAKAYKDLEQKLFKGAGKPPKSPDDYQLNLEDEKIKALFADGDPLKDPVMQALNQKLHDKGVSQDIYESVMNVALEAIADHMEENPGPDPIDVKAEKEKLGKNADAIIENQVQFLSGMFKRGEINEAQAQEILILTETAEGINALQALRSHYGEKQSIPMNLGSKGGIKSADELRTMQADKKYGTDLEYTKMVDAEYEKKYGSGRSGESMQSDLG